MFGEDGLGGFEGPGLVIVELDAGCFDEGCGWIG
jgi:hypothetical protein